MVVRPISWPRLRRTSRIRVQPPARVLDGQRDNEGAEPTRCARSSWASPGRAVVLLRNKLTVPAKNRIGAHDAPELAKATTANKLAPSSQTATLRVCETHLLFAEVLSENSILFLQILKHSALLSLKPASDKSDDEM